MADEITPFELDVPEAELADLRTRLLATRWPSPETVDDWSQGIPLAYVREVCDYWARDYDWRPVEGRLNGLGQFLTVLDGLRIHFVHARSPEPDALPLLLTHGWPGSVVEFLKVIGPLTDPVAHGGRAEDAFHVVCPSLPGYGFSDKPTAPGWTVERIAAAWSGLMGRLGYDRYGAQGGDWGAAVTGMIPLTDPDHCAGIHLTLALAARPRPGEELTAAEQRAWSARDEFLRTGRGYSSQQSTRPQTLGYGLADSPSGQAAWILEKFQAWSDCDGHPENVFTRDELLDNVMCYWLPNTGASSARLYWESFRRPPPEPVTVPVGYSRFPKELILPERRWVEAVYPGLQYWNELDRGGHFAAMEQPDLFVG
ncbi:MAG TPA: epoxide hydrolase, partial [Acidimicrobiales bacterium]|nr:epoxide hydrolase [Acidimicrobiales bacterium]